MLFRRQAVPENYTKGQTGGGNDEEKQEGVSVTFGRIDLTMVESTVSLATLVVVASRAIGLLG